MALREYEKVMKAVADPTRVRILKMLEGGELCVCQVIAVLPFNQSTISKHLFLLKNAGLVRERKQGKWVYYSLDGKEGAPYTGKMLRSLRGWLSDDPVVKKDGMRAALARDLGPVEVCERGMTLPAGRAAACCPPGREIPATK